MKILMQPIEMIAWFSKDKHPTPLRYRVISEDMDNVVVKIDRIIFTEEEKVVGNKMLIYRCQGIINGLEKVFELKYEITACKWYLFKL